MFKNILATVMFVSLSSCSVGMAVSGKKNPNFALIKEGASKAEIESQLGDPIDTKESKTKTVCTYEYELGNEPSTGRAVMHGVLDVLTIGGWEIIGTPVEGLQGTSYQITVIYNQDEIAEKIH